MKRPVKLAITEVLGLIEKEMERCRKHATSSQMWADKPSADRVDKDYWQREANYATWRMKRLGKAAAWIETTSENEGYRTE